jgi:hypothetical protein
MIWWIESGATKSGASLMNPKVGDVYVIDLGFEGKVRPVVVISREDSDAPRALSVDIATRVPAAFM